MDLGDCIFDLGDNGVFTMSLNHSWGSAGPVIMPNYYYANWYSPDGEKYSRLDLCTKTIPKEDLFDFFEEKSLFYQRSPASLKGQVELMAEKIRHEDAVVLPETAIKIDDNHILLVFIGVVGEPTLRIINILESKIEFQCHLKEIFNQEVLMEEVGNNQQIMNGNIFLIRERVKILYVWNSYFVVAPPGYDFYLFKANINGVKQIDLDGDSIFDYGSISNDLVFKNVRGSAEISISTLSGKELKSVVVSKFNGWMFGFDGCEIPGRFVLGHEGGTIELFDDGIDLQKGYRPVPKAGKNEQIRVKLSRCGRYITTIDYLDHRIIDTKNNLIADVDVPRRDEADRDVFVEVAGFSPDFMATKDAFHVVHRGVLISTPYTSLVWEPVVEAKPARKAGTKEKSKFSTRLLKKWRRPYVQLMQEKKGSEPAESKSHLYGVTGLPAGTQWPSFKGQPMLLLCSMAFDEVAHLLLGQDFPEKGVLLVFVAVDEQGEIIENEFTPAKIDIMYLPETAVLLPLPILVPSKSAISLKMTPGKNDLPYIDSAVVEAEELSDEKLEAYRSHLEAMDAEPPSLDFRFGGYPNAVQNNTLERESEGFSETGELYELSDDINASLKWRLLLQFDSDDEFMWGTDMGKLYLMINEDDLVEKNFSRVVAITAGS